MNYELLNFYKTRNADMIYNIKNIKYQWNNKNSIITSNYLIYFK